FGLAIDLSLAGLFGTMATFLLLTLLRSLYAALAGGIFPAAQAYIADVTGPAERTAGVAMIGAAFGLGMIAGPAAAAALAGFSLVTPFYGVAVMALVAAAVA